MRALIFDCDGVLAETESQGHLVAFNRMWVELGVPWQWNLTQYRAALTVGGGRERLLALLDTPGFQAVYPVPAAPADREALAACWHSRKSEIFQQLIHEGGIPARPGVKRLAKEALHQGWLLGVASTSAPASVAAVMRHVFGQPLAARFSAVLAGDSVRRKKPDPEVYTLSSLALAVAPGDCVVVEDSAIGLSAATAAGMRCIVTVSEMTAGEDFSSAALVVSHLGDPGGPHARMLSKGSQCCPHRWITIDDLEQL